MSHPASPGVCPPDESRSAQGSSPAEPGAENLPAKAVPGAVLYEERLSAAWWMWLLVLFAGLVGFIALAPINMWAGTAVGAVVAGGTAVALIVSSTGIVITGESLQVGRARIERRFVGEAEAFRGSAVQRVRGPELDARAYMNFRVSVGPVVRIQITDPVDPTPYWLTSTRHPERIVEILSAG
ncbi:DUF3093 domain-containing protein [Kocuria marina]|uniref:DUF3093 domain-containing protein n=1 Tax=Kocuria marina TaxID=223184 RepID=UPI0022E37CAA|nr:DUF3093 domain-containing protein [Kocuria marina]